MWAAQRECHRVLTSAHGAASGHREDLVRSRSPAAGGTGAAGAQLRAAAGVLEDTTIRSAVAPAPVEQRVEHGPQVPSGGRELVDLAARPFVIWLAVENSVLDETAEAVREDCAGHVEVVLEIVEAPDAIEGITNDQKGPALAEYLQCACQRAVLAYVVLAEHVSEYSVGSMIEPWTR
jgi:hypothetical protein